MIATTGKLFDVSLELISVNGESIPVGSGNQLIERTVLVKKIYQNPIDNFLSIEMENKVLGKKYNYKIDGDLFFSAHRDDLICKISKSKVAKDIKEGEIIQNEKGNTAYVLSNNDNDDFILADFNHPLSGKKIEFDMVIKAFS